ncbi:MAG: hypothetical protein WEE66_02930, partial [Actinomycetota bacterium]
SWTRSRALKPAKDTSLLEIIDDSDYLGWQAEGREVRGRVLDAAGRHDEARAAFGEALERFERKGDRPCAERVGGRLASLPS